jgi:NAD(P)H-dependent FMN reductase
VADGRLGADLIDPRALGVTALHGDMKPENLAALKTALARLEAFIIVTPEYNHSFPVRAKSLIDPGKEESETKLVAFVPDGGIFGGLSAAERAHIRAPPRSLRPASGICVLQ